LPRPLLCTGALLGGLLWAPAWAAATDASPSWASLTPAQQQTLAPLQREWSTIERNRKQKWLEIAARFPSMPPDERKRVQERMVDWANLSPADRTRARLQYQEARQLPPQERQARWQAYQALSDDERSSLARRAAPAAKAASAAAAPARSRPASEQAGGKRNMVLSVAGAPRGAIAPVVVQATPGATTTTMSVRAVPPAHNQPGLPKIAATPGFVDPATLLPQRGPQGAAVRAAASTEAGPQP
jgi:hypothetical protein